ncbi:TorF family putative porin [Cupriavidus basilensis]
MGQALAQSAAEPAAEPASAWTFSANVALATDYRYRGLMQTNRRPAIQGGFDVSHTSGFYLGNWNSNISWLGDSNPDVSAPIEMGFSWRLQEYLRRRRLELLTSVCCSTTTRGLSGRPCAALYHRGLCVASAMARCS